MRATIIGAGYVGLVSAACLARHGHDVTCVDAQAHIVARLNAGIPHIHEKGLPELLAEVVAAGRFRASTDLATALADADIAIIAVGTPAGADGAIDLRQVVQVARAIGGYIQATERFLPVVTKSSVIPGTTDTVVRREIEQVSGKRLGAFGLGMNPEFLREGVAIADFEDPDRIVLGHEDPRTLAALETLYAPWDCEKVRVNCRTAELIKYANNAVLASQISLINEIANLATAVGDIDVMDVVRGIQLDKRWSPLTATGRITPGILEYLVPGCGFGGSCFPKDVAALRAQGAGHGLPMRMLDAVLSVNEAQPIEVVTMLDGVMPMSGSTHLLLGLAFKPNTDDVRDSASLKIAAALLNRGGRVIAHDPVAATNFAAAMGPVDRLTYTEEWAAAVASVDTIIIATRWEDYRALAKLDLKGKIVVDARRLLSPSELPGARYFSIGRSSLRQNRA